MQPTDTNNDSILDNADSQTLATEEKNKILEEELENVAVLGYN